MGPGALVCIGFYNTTQLQATSNLTNSTLNFHFLLSSIQKGLCSVPRETDAAPEPLYTQNSSESSFVPTEAQVQ